MAKIIEFKKYHQAKTRSKVRARQIMHDLEERKDCYVVIPPGVDPYAGNFEEEIAKVLYESEVHRAEK